MVRVLISLFLLALPAHAAVVPTGVPSSGIGKDLNVVSSPAIVLPTSANERYTITCGNGTSNITDGNRYKCFKNTVGTANTDWSIPNGTTVKCDGFYTSVNNTTTVGIIFHHATAALGSNNTSSAPSGDVGWCTNGTCYNWSQDSAKPVWHAYPITWENATGSTIYPHVQIFTGGTHMVVITFKCYTQ